MSFKAATFLRDDDDEDVAETAFSPAPAAPQRSAFVPSEAFQIGATRIVDLRQAVETSSPVGATLTRQLLNQDEEEEEAAMPPVDPDTIRAEGFAAGRRAAEEEYRQDHAALRALIANLDNAAMKQLSVEADAIGPALGRLALSIARDVVGDAQAVAPKSIAARVETALEAFSEARKKPVLTINAADVAFIEASPMRMTIATDADMARGDFHLKCGDMEILDRISQRLALAERAVT